MNNVRDFGASGDGVTADTAAIQKAIDAGGTAFFPPGVYLSGSLYLRSGGGLYLEPGALLLGSPNPADYNADDFCPQNRVFKQEYVSGAHLINAVGIHDVTIRGGGRIDGNRCAFYSVDETHAWGEDRPKIQWRPGQMLFFCECENVILEDVQLTNAPYWTCFLHGCEQVTARGLRIRNNVFTPNGDGIDIDCCRFVNVTGCFIESGDDSITLRAYKDPLKKARPCEYITVSDCVLRTKCNAFRIGVGSGEIRDAMISNCVIHETRSGINICSKYSKEMGVDIRRVFFDHMRIDAKIPIRVATNAWGRDMGPSLNPVRNLAFRNFSVSGECPCVVEGYGTGDVSDVIFSDFDLHQTAGGNDCGISAFQVLYAKDIRFERFRLRCADDVRTPWQYGILAENAEEVRMRDCEFGRPCLLNGKVSS